MSDTVFVRKATGLVREVGLLSGILFNVTQAANLSAQPAIVPYWVMYSYGGNLWLACGIGFLGALLVNSVYAHFTAAMPRSGGEYVFLGRTMNAVLGFVVNWTMVAVFLFWFVFNTVWCIGVSRSILYTIYPMEAVSWITIWWVQYLLGAVIMTIATLIGVFGMKLYCWLQNVFWIPAIIAAVVVALGFLAAAGNFPAIFNAWALKYVPTQPDMYHNIINDATAAGYTPLPSEGPMMEQTLTWAAMILSYISPYTLMTTYVAGELKRAESGIRQHIFVEGAAVIWMVLFILLGWTWINMGGFRLLSSFFYLGGSVPGLPLDTLSWSWARIVLPPWANWLYLLAAFLTVFMAITNYSLAISRCILAWSFDRTFPTRLAHVDRTYKSPTYAIGALYVVGLVVLALAVSPGINIWTYIAAASFWTLINMMIVCIAGMIFPYVRKDMFELMPIKARIGGIPLLTIIGFFGFVVTAWTTAAYFINPAFGASFGITSTSIAFTVLIYVSGVVIFYGARDYWRRKGIDTRLAFKQIPPA